MTEQEWMKRIDAHLERGEETMRLLRADQKDLRRFIREEGIRRDRIVRQFVEQSQAAEQRLEDMGDQIRANTAATWAMVDEMNKWRD